MPTLRRYSPRSQHRRALDAPPGYDYNGSMPKEEWRESLRPRIDAARRDLSSCEAAGVARRAGLIVREAEDSGAVLDLPLLGRTYAIAWPELTIAFPDGTACPEEFAILVLDYLARSDGSTPTGEWIGFQELPDGAFYRHAFQGYSGDQLARDLSGDIDRFRRAAGTLGGEPLPMGDAGYAFRVLPHVPLGVVWWEGDEDFPANATVLFDRVAGVYLPTDGLAILGRMLCRAIAKVGDPG